MCRLFAFFLFTAMAALCPLSAQSIEVKTFGPSPLPPGVPPENAFPLVFYMVGMRSDITDLLRKEAESFQENGPRSHLLSEQYADGVPVPQYEGYIVVDESFRITVYNRFPNKAIEQWADKMNAISKDDKEVAIRLRAPRWSWNGVACAIQQLTGGPAVYAVAYSMGQQADPEYRPQVKQTAILTVKEMRDGFWQVMSRASFPIKAIDFTITNPKPGMTFKLIDGDFTIP